MAEPRRFRFVYDVERRQPACVLLQALYGGDQSVGRFFDASAWLLSPTDGMRMVEGTEDEWRRAAALPPREVPHG